MFKFLLGSESPGRKHVLTKYGLSFDSIAPQVDEKSLSGTISFQQALDLVLFNSQLKLDKIRSTVSNLDQYICIIASDTTVYCNRKIYEKTYDKSLATQLLNELAGKNHQVITGVSIFFPRLDEATIENPLKIHDITDVTITANHDLIDFYLLSDDCLGKAGCYGVQGPGSLIIDQITGQIDTVIGLPMAKILSSLPQSILKNLKSNY